MISLNIVAARGVDGKVHTLHVGENRDHAQAVYDRAARDPKYDELSLFATDRPRQTCAPSQAQSIADGSKRAQRSLRPAVSKIKG